MPNGDFEYYTQCPDDYGQINRAYPWYNSNDGSCDYYNTCVISSGIFLDVRVPQNSYGYQYPHSGEGYGGVAVVNNEFVYYEYATTPLLSPLIAGEDYCVSFWVSLADSLCLGFNKLGVYFSADSVNPAIGYHNDVIPQIVWTEFIVDKENWSLVESSFIAQGGERFMTIGTFDTTGIELYNICENLLWQSAYYYIDDVSVELASESCNSETFEIPNIFTPNADGTNDVWKLESNKEFNVTIVNRWGNIVFQQTSKTIIWDGNDLNDGVYYYIIRTKYNKKTGFIHLIR